MSSEDRSSWQAIDSLLDEALDLPAAQRRAHVLARTREQPAVGERVLALLAASEQAQEFLETGPQPAAPAARPQALSQDQLPSQQRIGPWRILALLGRGGMGEVYKAQRDDGLYQQTVALKLLRLDQPDQLARFASERQILANLDHPNLARLIDGGVDPDGRPWMAMEFVDGIPLRDWLAQQQPSIDERLDLLLQLCPAISHAHERLVVHRDIKPDNILVDQQGQPRLLDFGIAKLNPGLREGETTQALATPNYAAPEQLQGQPITTATDVYGLGACLFFLLTGQPPVQLQGLSLPAMLDAICHRQAAAPSSLVLSHERARVAGDLDAICGKALARAPGDRYPSIAALAADLQRHRQHLPITARPLGRFARASRWVRRHALASAAVLAVACSLLGGLGVASWQAHQAASERDLARREAARLSSMRTAMLQLFRSAASESDSEQLTARELFSLSASHIERDFGHDPATAAGLMQMLGELQLFTENYAGARELLQRAQALPAERVPDDVLAGIRIDLAHLAYRDGDYAQARQLYQQAMDIWQREPSRYPAERIWAATLASQLARAEGRSSEAVTRLQQAATEARRHWGEAHQETGVVLINLAVALYYDNRLADALVACAEAWQVWQAIDRADSPDALNLLANWGLFALRHGRPWEGERRLSEALELRTQLYGASAAQATLMKNLGIAHRVNGRMNAGMRLLEQGEWMAREYAGVGGRLHASAVFALARALIEDGAEAEALKLLREQQASAGDKNFSWRFLNQALLASLLTAPAQLGEAEALFSGALLGLAAIGNSALSQLADAQLYRARHARARGDIDSAMQWLNQAIESKTRARRDGHFEVIAMQYARAELLQLGGEPERAQRLHASSRQRAIAELGAEHPLSQRQPRWL